MNNTFDFGRFSLLIRRQWINFGRVYLMALGILLGIFIAFYGYNFTRAVSEGDHHAILNVLNFRPYVFIILGLLFITIVASTYFSNLGDKSKAIFELLIPASQLEKFVVGIFYSFIVPVVSFLLLFFLVDLAFVSYERKFFVDFISSQVSEFAQGNLIDKNSFEYFYTIKFPKEATYSLAIPVVLSSIFLFGSIFFNKFHYIKTMISLVVYCLVYVFMMVKIMNGVTMDTINVNRDDYFSSEDNVLWVMSVIGLVLGVIFWIIGYYRLKEKEV